MPNDEPEEMLWRKVTLIQNVRERTQHHVSCASIEPLRQGCRKRSQTQPRELLLALPPGSAPSERSARPGWREALPGYGQVLAYESCQSFPIVIESCVNISSILKYQSELHVASCGSMYALVWTCVPHMRHTDQDSVPSVTLSLQIILYSNKMRWL